VTAAPVDTSVPRETGSQSNSPDTKAEEKLRQLEKELADARGLIADLEKENRDLKAKNDELVEEFQAQQKKIGDLNSELTQLKEQAHATTQEAQPEHNEELSEY